MPIIATVPLRGSCPKKKDPDDDTPMVGFNIEARARIPSNIPRYMVEQWLETKHVVRVDPEHMMEDGKEADPDFWDEYEDFPAEIAPLAELDDKGKVKLPKPKAVDAKANMAELKRREAQEKADNEAGVERHTKEKLEKEAASHGKHVGGPGVSSEENPKSNVLDKNDRKGVAKEEDEPGKAAAKEAESKLGKR